MDLRQDAAATSKQAGRLRYSSQAKCAAVSVSRRGAYSRMLAVVMKFWGALFPLVFAVALRAAESLPLFNATLTVGKEHRFVLVDPNGQASSFLSLGETFAGYKLKAYDAKAGELELERDGKISRVTLVTDAATI